MDCIEQIRHRALARRRAWALVDSVPVCSQKLPCYQLAVSRSWSLGVLESWSLGVLESWGSGVCSLGYWGLGSCRFR